MNHFPSHLFRYHSQFLLNFSPQTHLIMTFNFYDRENKFNKVVSVLFAFYYIMLCFYFSSFIFLFILFRFPYFCCCFICFRFWLLIFFIWGGGVSFSYLYFMSYLLFLYYLLFIVSLLFVVALFCLLLFFTLSCFAFSVCITIIRALLAKQFLLFHKAIISRGLVFLDYFPCWGAVTKSKSKAANDFNKNFLT